MCQKLCWVLQIIANTYTALTTRHDFKHCTHVPLVRYVGIIILMFTDEDTEAEK